MVEPWPERTPRSIFFTHTLLQSALNMLQFVLWAYLLGCIYKRRLGKKLCLRGRYGFNEIFTRASPEWVYDKLPWHSQFLLIHKIHTRITPNLVFFCSTALLMKNKGYVSSLLKWSVHSKLFTYNYLRVILIYNKLILDLH